MGGLGFSGSYENTLPRLPAGNQTSRMPKLHRSFDVFTFDYSALSDGDDVDPIDTCDTNKISNIQVLEPAQFATNGGNNIWLDPLCPCICDCSALQELDLGNIQYDYDDGITSFSTSFTRITATLRKLQCSTSTWVPSVEGFYVAWIQYASEISGCTPTFNVIFSANSAFADKGPRFLLDGDMNESYDDDGASPDGVSTQTTTDAKADFDNSSLMTIIGTWTGLSGDSTLEIDTAKIIDVMAGEQVQLPIPYDPGTPASFD